MKPVLTVRTLVTLAVLLSGGAAVAHEFTAAILVTGQNPETRLAEAVNGFLLAADERDAHSNETSDGHLGGVDVQVLPLPTEAAGLVSWLVGSPADEAGVVVVLGTEPATLPDVAAISPRTVTMVPGILPQDWFEDAGNDSFVARYRSAYGTAPTEAAAQGYNAARRLDSAIRPLDGISPRVALEAALADTANGIDWQENSR
jgi:hypothetical protein